MSDLTRESPLGDENDITQRKAALRKEMQQRLRDIGDLECRRASREACARLEAMDELRDAGTVLFYMAMRSELDPSMAMRACLEDGITVAVPKIDPQSRELEAIEIESLDPRFFDRDRMGILTPRDGRLVRATEIDTVVAPGLAFDRSGGRLGRGAGYYDRLLVRVSEHCSTVGFCYGFQLVDEVPATALDRRVQRIVTEAETV
jgi:5-formyltetrahydrofolate cyclo-ligase